MMSVPCGSLSGVGARCHAQVMVVAITRPDNSARSAPLEGQDMFIFNQWSLCSLLDRKHKGTEHVNQVQ